MLAYALTVFLSAFLLFQVELVIGKELLPWFGGTPSVWTTCLMFFQVVLLAGYTYSHYIIQRLRGRIQTILHFSVIGASILLLLILAFQWPSPITPDASWKPEGNSEPISQLLLLLTISVGLPFFVLSTTGPLLQSWFASMYPGKSPYRLYALSNIGSLLGLLSYPILVEPSLTIHSQAIGWTIGFVFFCGGVVLCAAGVKKSGALISSEVTMVRGSNPTPAPSLGAVFLWTGLAAVASALMLSTTNHMCQDTAIIPMLWVLPLSIYLLTFILCFEYERFYQRWLFPALFAGCLAPVVVVLYTGLKVPILIQTAVDAAVLFTGCVVCHGELAKSKPDTAHLTRFYLAVAGGGAIGGLSVALLAPNVFKGFWEFHLSLFAVGIVFLAAIIHDRLSFFYTKPWVIGPALGVLMIALGYFLVDQILLPPAGTRFVTRNFYGVLRVVENVEENSLELLHGRVSHGLQYQEADRRRIPTTYYSRESGVGIAIENHPRREQGLRIGVVGLGAGTIAAYGRAIDAIRFYEINPAIPKLSEGKYPFFTYLKDCRGHVDVVLGDARLTLESELQEGRNKGYDVLVVDAFSGDAIPVHLLTREAFEIYLRHLRPPDGILAIHISNRYLNLIPVVRGFAEGRGLSNILIRAGDNEEGGCSSDWILVSPSQSVLHLPRFDQRATSWDSVETKSIRPWTDDYSNLISVLK